MHVGTRKVKLVVNLEKSGGWQIVGGSLRDDREINPQNIRRRSELARCEDNIQ